MHTASVVSDDELPYTKLRLALVAELRMCLQTACVSHAAVILTVTQDYQTNSKFVTRHNVRLCHFTFCAQKGGTQRED